MELLGKSNEMKGGGLWGELATNQHCIQGDVTEIWMNPLTLILPLMSVRKLFLPKMSNMKLKKDCALFFQVNLVFSFQIFLVLPLFAYKELYFKFLLLFLHMSSVHCPSN